MQGQKKYICMKSLYESILSSTNAGKASIIKAWLDKNGIKNYTINSKGEVDVNEDVKLSRRGLTEFPSFIQFGTVKGNFFCSDNKLTSLKGSPMEVSGYFYCYDNDLTTLEGAPKKVGKVFDCSSNKLTSLEGAPREVGESFHCNNNKLNSLKGAPKEIGGGFFCKNNTTKFTEDDVRKVCKVEKKIYV